MLQERQYFMGKSPLLNRIHGRKGPIESFTRVHYYVSKFYLDPEKSKESASIAFWQVLGLLLFYLFFQELTESEEIADFVRKCPV